MQVDVNGIIQDQAQQSGVDPNLALAIILHGENSQQNAVSPKGAIGYSQLMPATAAGLGVNPRDPEQNLRGGVRYIRQIQDELGTTDPSLIAAGYNAGPGAVKSHGGIPNYPETQAYVQRVKAAMPQNQQFADSDFETDTKSGATQAQNSSAIAPKFADSDFEAAPPVQAASAPGGSFTSQLHRALGLTARDVLEGGSKLLGIVGDPANYLANKATGSNLPTVSSQGGALADRLGLPTPQGGLETGVNNAAQALVGAGGQAAVARGTAALASNPVVTGALGQLASNMGGQAAGAVTGSAAADLSHRGGQAMDLNPYLQTGVDLMAGMLGGTIGGGLTNRATNGVAPEIQNTLNAAKSANVPVQLSDVSPGWASLARLTDKMPFGLGNLSGKGVSGQQIAGVRDALSQAAEQYRPSGLDATSGTQGTDRFLANDLRSVAGQRQAQSNDLYKAVDNIAGGSALPAAELPQTAATAADLWQRYPDAFKGLELDAKTRGMLNAFKPEEAAAEAPHTVNVGGVEMQWDKLNPQMRSLLESQGFGPEAAPEKPPLTFQNLNDLRTGLGDILGQAKQAANSGTQSRTKVGIFSQMYKAVTDDIDNYMNRPDVPPELKEAATAAQDHFKNNVLPLRNDARINEVLAHPPGADGADTAAEGLHNYLFSANKGETAQKYLGLLSPAGQQAAAYQAIKGATDSALNTATEAGIKSATGIGKLGNSPALDAVAAVNPGMSNDIARIQTLMRLGRTAATTEAGKGALTGFQTRDLGSLLAMQKGAETLQHHGLSAGAAYGLGAGVPLGASNIVSWLNSRSPEFLRNYLLANKGSAGQRMLPGALASQMQEGQ